mmetsp:Transcript_20105/g.30230  ORF Transcript_20105/g.30230 Transcript_20105/m.30230 type:complete len:551 (-) Transcript_20105:4577-6229(-)
MEVSIEDRSSNDSLGYQESGAAPAKKEMEPLKPSSLYLEMPSNDHDGEITYEPTLIEQEYTIFPHRVYEWLYPPKVPRECQMLRIENLAVPACYLLVGILQGLQGPFTNVYPLDLGATEAQQVTVSTIRSIPASFKLLFGFMSDNFPLLGYRRKSYMFIGWLMAGTAMVTLMAFSNLSSPKEEIPEDAPSMPFLSLCLLVFGTGFWLADVMGDSIVAEKAKLEIEKGHIQSTCYACRFFGLMTAAPLSTFMYSHIGPGSIVFLMSLLPLAILPTLWYLSEVRDAPVKSTKEQCNEIWHTVCSRAVWQPMGFVYLYNLLQVSNGAWKNFQKVILGLTSEQLNWILNVAYVLLYVGVMAYKWYFISWSWRSVYIGTTLLNAVFSALQILLIFDITFGLSYFWFSLGDDALAEFVGGIQFLPTTIMMVHLCPAGSEGASYAMFTTVNNSALNLSSAISTRLLAIWDVSLEALQAGQKTGIFNLTLLTTVLQLSGILFVGLLPRTKDDLAKLGDDSARSSTGGAIFLIITFCSIIYALVVAALNIVAPGWSGES